jgi:hypothetical protein
MNELKYYASIVNNSKNEIRINWPSNENYAYAMFSSIKEANECRYHLNGKSIPNSDKLMVDYVDTKLFYYEKRKNDTQESNRGRSKSRSPTRIISRRVVAKSRSPSRPRSIRSDRLRSSSPLKSDQKQPKQVVKMNIMENFTITTTLDNVRRIDSPISNQIEKIETNSSKTLNINYDSLTNEPIKDSILAQSQQLSKTNDNVQNESAPECVDLSQTKKSEDDIETTVKVKKIDDEQEDGQIEDTDLSSNTKVNENGMTKIDNHIENENKPKSDHENVEFNHEQEPNVNNDNKSTNIVFEIDSEAKSNDAQPEQKCETYSSNKSNLVDSVLIDTQLFDKITTFEEFFQIFNPSDQQAKENLWSHVFVLKKKIKHHAKFFLISGSKQFTTQYMSHENQLELTINQRMHSDSSKMNEIQKKLNESILNKSDNNTDTNNYALFVSVPENDGISIQSQKLALNSIISYLNEKEVAGVTLLDSGANIYTFSPSSQFATQLLHLLMPNLDLNPSNSKDYLNNFLIVLLLKS